MDTDPRPDDRAELSTTGLGIVTSVPIAAASIGLALFAQRRGAATPRPRRPALSCRRYRHTNQRTRGRCPPDLPQSRNGLRRESCSTTVFESTTPIAVRGPARSTGPYSVDDGLSFVPQRSDPALTDFASGWFCHHGRRFGPLLRWSECRDGARWALFPAQRAQYRVLAQAARGQSCEQASAGSSTSGSNAGRATPTLHARRRLGGAHVKATPGPGRSPQRDR